MKRNFEDKAMRMAKLARQEEEWLSEPQCIICRSWRRPCPACKAKNGSSGKATRSLTPKEIAERVLEVRHSRPNSE